MPTMRNRCNRSLTPSPPQTPQVPSGRRGTERASDEPLRRREAAREAGPPARAAPAAGAEGPAPSTAARRPDPPHTKAQGPPARGGGRESGPAAKGAGDEGPWLDSLDIRAGRWRAESDPGGPTPPNAVHHWLLRGAPRLERRGREPRRVGAAPPSRPVESGWPRRRACRQAAVRGSLRHPARRPQPSILRYGACCGRLLLRSAPRRARRVRQPQVAAG